MALGSDVSGRACMACRSGRAGKWRHHTLGTCVCVGFLPVSMYATSITIGNGQLPLHLLPALAVGLELLSRRGSEWRTDLLAAGLVLVALVKPSVTVPFLWLALFVPGRLRPALLIGLGYLALTLFAASFQDSEVVPLASDWGQRAAGGAAWGAQGGARPTCTTGWPFGD